MTEQNEALARLRSLIGDYLETAAELEAKRRPTDGLLGMRPGPADDPCHDRFAEQMDALLQDYAAQRPSSAEAAAVLRELFAAAPANRNAKSAYWMLIAVQGFGSGLIPFLDKAEAAGLLELYSAQYPRRERLPVQNRILKQLARQAA